MSKFKNLMVEIQVYNKNNNKEVLKEKQEIILTLYRDLCEELEMLNESTSHIAIESSICDVTIRLTSSTYLLISEFDIILNKLMSLSDMKTIEMVDGKIMLMMWFRCWEYRKREVI